MQKYWVCWNKRGGAFKTEHPTLEDAKAEATRLVKKTGDPIDILESLMQVKSMDTPVVFDQAYQAMKIYNPAEGL